MLRTASKCSRTTAGLQTQKAGLHKPNTAAVFPLHLERLEVHPVPERSSPSLQTAPRTIYDCQFNNVQPLRDARENVCVFHPVRLSACLPDDRFTLSSQTIFLRKEPNAEMLISAERKTMMAERRLGLKRLCGDSAAAAATEAQCCA